MRTIFRKNLLILLLCSIGFSAYAQQKISGSVKDIKGEALSGVNILVDGKAAAATDLNGQFVLNSVRPESIVSVSFIGFQKQSRQVGQQKELIFILEEDSEFLDEAVVVGYGVVKKNDLTGSVGSVNTEKLVMKGTSTLMEALQGSVAGVNITQNSSRAGGSFNINIRGRSSLNSSTTPLYVVDGVICNDIQWLNQQDIERIDILKDASSTAIYGSRATAGVVLVTTKGALGQGREQKSTISYDGYYGISQMARVPDFQDGDEFYTYRLRKFLIFAGESGNTPQPIYTMSDYEKMALVTSAGSGVYVLKQMIASGKTVDWPSVIARDGLQQNHYLSVNGSSGDVNYLLGVGYNDIKGIYAGDEEQKINLKGSVDAKVNNFVRAGFSFNMANIQNQYASDNGVQGAYIANPFIRPYDDDGNIIRQPGNRFYIGTEQEQFSDAFNPLLYWENEEKARNTWRLLGNMYLSIKPFKSLEFKSTFSPSYTSYKEGFYSGTLTGDVTNHAHSTVSNGFSWTWDNMLTWNKNIDDIHLIHLMALSSATAGYSESENIYATGVTEGTTWYNLKSGIIDADNTSNGYSESSMLSYAFRANYTLLNRYMATATIRWDGSSKFAQQNRWGSFPSFALAWRASEEEWLDNAEDWLSNLKLRVAYGITGNNAGIGNYATQVTVSGPNYYVYGDNFVGGFYPSGIVNKDLKWEKSNEINIGLDYGFFDNRIHGSLDWYTKTSSDLLYNVQLPLVAAGKTMTTNIGSVRNQGIEASLTTVNVSTQDLHWETTFVFAQNKNEVLDINGLGTDLPSTGMTGGLFIGHPTENVYAYQWDGIVSDRLMTVPESALAIEHGFTPGTQVKSCDYYFNIYRWNEGQPIIRDVNQDGKFNDDDKRIYSSAPKWTGSFNTSLTYKNWDFSASIYSKVGYYVSSPFYSYYLRMSDRGHSRLNRDWYIPAGTLLNCDGIKADGTLINPVYQENTHYGSYPFPNTGAANDGVGKDGTLWSENANTIVEASFMKVKNITLGYTFPKKWLDSIKCQHLRLYMTVTNPFVLTAYDGFDPEWANTNLNQDGPSTITYQLGANIKF